MKTREEIENETDVLEELVENYENLKEWERKQVGVRTISNVHPSCCPRCQVRTCVISGHPYCQDCNWDSLTDPSYGSEQCAT